MDETMRIAEVARRSGFPAPTLRYYEEIDLLPAPRRTPSGYRDYDESVLARLAFLARAKRLGCTLAEIADLMPRWDGGRCAPVQDGLRELVEAKLGVTQDRVVELAALAGDLQGILDTLATHTPEGPCDSECGCVGETSSPALPPSTVAPAPGPAARSAPPIACTLDVDQMPGRLGEWDDILAHVLGRLPIDGGVRLQLDATTELAELTRLVGSERSCCAFFAFAITIEASGSKSGRRRLPNRSWHHSSETSAPPDRRPASALTFDQATPDARILRKQDIWPGCDRGPTPTGRKEPSRFRPCPFRSANAGAAFGCARGSRSSGHAE